MSSDHSGKAQAVAIVADDLLQQQRLRNLLTEAGYDVVVSTAPERLNPALVSSSTIGLWLVDADLEHCPERVRDALYDARDCRVLFDEAPDCDRQDMAYRLWEKRLLTSVHRALDNQPEQTEQAAEDVARETPEDLQRLPATGPSALHLPKALENWPEDQPRPLWILAASLGGPSAVKDFLDRLPEGLPCRFIYAQHIDGHFEEQLERSLGRHCALPVQRLRSGSMLPPGVVHIAPVANSIRIAPGGRVQHNEYGWRGPFSPCLDELMQTMALSYEGPVNAIVFSGMGGDALIGASTLQEAGGQVWIQSPESCIQPAMPAAIREAGLHSGQGDTAALAQSLLHLLQQQLKGEQAEAPEATATSVPAIAQSERR
ncbi:MAG: chemotaxis protein CheB [Natronospirillum sp.]|uniref:chemotaxis protein CheB n=1 Tax=Natronospirillum sp. TaxID=2812955 RepID=UPI0025F9BA45|nr:chemotaxis protein CheB [Natronospirillum sp.]MCH8551699.1 chemotaxis protein CheB [Natronospirillum sp.]